MLLYKIFPQCFSYIKFEVKLIMIIRIVIGLFIITGKNLYIFIKSKLKCNL